MIKWNSIRYPFHKGHSGNYVSRFITKKIFNSYKFPENTFQVEGSGNEIKVDVTNKVSLKAIGPCLSGGTHRIPIVLVTATQ